MENNTQLDFATLALKGKRYQEAENIYMQLATNNNSSEAWLGIGVCKLYQLTEGKTMDEVIFCFNKAKNITPELTAELDNQLMMHTMAVLKTYAQIIENAAIKHQAAKKAAQKGAFIAGLSIVAGMNSTKAFSTVASLAGTGAGVGVAVESLNAMNDYNSLIIHVLNKCNEAYSGVTSIVNKQTDEYQQFDNNLKSIITYVEGALKSVSNNNSNKNQGVSKTISNIKFNLSKSLVELQNEYRFSDEDFIRLSFLSNNHKAISMSNFKQNEEYKKELNSLFSKYNVGMFQRGNIIVKLKKEPVH